MNIKFLVAILILTLSATSISAQKNEIYNPKANAVEDIENALAKASKEGKHVFLQIGGNWCPWCVKFHNFLQADEELISFAKENYEFVKVNYDRENKQIELLEKLEFPQRFGFPVFVVLDGKGNRIHTQNSAFLEKDKNYDKKRVMKFFKNWSATAINPNSYKK
jgi:thioredoxin-related protein